METIKLNKIKKNPDNPRLIKDDKFVKLCRSLSEFPEMMEKRPIVVDENWVILGGNMRYEALKANGMKDIPVSWISIAEGWSEEKKREFVIKDNASFGEWNWDDIADKWSDCDLSGWGIDTPEGWGEKEEEKEAKEDDFNEEEETIVCRCKKGDIWKCGNHRVMCGDSTQVADVQKLMGGGRADLYLTDPPYNVAVQNSQGMKIMNDDMGSKEFNTFLFCAFSAASSVMRDGAAFYVWFAAREHINFESALFRAGLETRQELIWNKNHFTMGRQDYQWKHEPCLYGWKAGSSHYFVEERNNATVIPDAAEIAIDKMKKEEMKDLLHKIFDAHVPTTVIDEQMPVKDSEHPTMKPVRLFGRLIKNSSKIGESVLDTFGGSGTTLVACEQLNRKCYMMELDPHYCDVILARWEKLTGKTAEKLTD